jgi:SAM-dependent methyltransferase
MTERKEKPFYAHQPIEPYTQVSKFYDHLMCHVDYVAWAEYLTECFEIFGKQIHTVLDAGCGTGSLACELQRRGFLTAGFDISFGMLQKARFKGLHQIWQAEMIQPGVKGNWDSVICLYDTVHYLTAVSVPLFFTEIRRVIKEKAIFIFDAVTEYHMKTYWADYTEEDEANGYRYVRRCWYEKKERCQHSEFKVFSQKGSGTFHEHHQQWIHPLSFFKEQAEDCGFSLYGPFDECTFEKGDESSERVHFILMRRNS